MSDITITLASGDPLDIAYSGSAPNVPGTFCSNDLPSWVTLNTGNGAMSAASVPATANGAAWTVCLMADCESGCSDTGDNCREFCINLSDVACDPVTGITLSPSSAPAGTTTTIQVIMVGGGDPSDAVTLGTATGTSATTPVFNAATGNWEFDLTVSANAPAGTLPVSVTNDCTTNPVTEDVDVGACGTLTSLTTDGPSAPITSDGVNYVPYPSGASQGTIIIGFWCNGVSGTCNGTETLIVSSVPASQQTITYNPASMNWTIIFDASVDIDGTHIVMMSNPCGDQVSTTVNFSNTGSNTGGGGGDPFTRLCVEPSPNNIFTAYGLWGHNANRPAYPATSGLPTASNAAQLSSALQAIDDIGGDIVITASFAYGQIPQSGTLANPIRLISDTLHGRSLTGTTVTGQNVHFWGFSQNQSLVWFRDFPPADQVSGTNGKVMCCKFDGVTSASAISTYSDDTEIGWCEFYNFGVGAIGVVHDGPTPNGTEFDSPKRTHIHHCSTDNVWTVFHLGYSYYMNGLNPFAIVNGSVAKRQSGTIIEWCHIQGPSSDPEIVGIKNDASIFRFNYVEGLSGDNHYSVRMSDDMLTYGNIFDQGAALWVMRVGGYRHKAIYNMAYMPSGGIFAALHGDWYQKPNAGTTWGNPQVWASWGEGHKGGIDGEYRKNILITTNGTMVAQRSTYFPNNPPNSPTFPATGNVFEENLILGSVTGYQDDSGLWPLSSFTANNTLQNGVGGYELTPDAASPGCYDSASTLTVDMTEVCTINHPVWGTINIDPADMPWLGTYS